MRPVLPILLPSVLLSACAPEYDSHLPKVRLDPEQLTLSPARYDANVLFDFFTVTNTGADIIYLSVATPEGDGGELLDVRMAPFTELTPEQSRPVEIAIDPSVWRWRTGTFSPTVQLEARYFFSGQPPDQAENPSTTEAPEPIAMVFTLPVTFEINCDLDGDGFDAAACAPACTGTGDNRTCQPSDCRDDIDTINPDAVETCNARDDDCDGGVDDNALDIKFWYYDSDGDSRGDDVTVTESCFQPAAKWVLVGGDCDDGDPGVLPGAPELCDGADNDCDNDVDEGC